MPPTASVGMNASATDAAQTANDDEALPKCDFGRPKTRSRTANANAPQPPSVPTATATPSVVPQLVSRARASRYSAAATTPKHHPRCRRLIVQTVPTGDIYEYWPK